MRVRYIPIGISGFGKCCRCEYALVGSCAMSRARRVPYPAASTTTLTGEGVDEEEEEDDGSDAAMFSFVCSNVDDVILVRREIRTPFQHHQHNKHKYPLITSLLQTIVVLVRKPTN